MQCPTLDQFFLIFYPTENKTQKYLVPHYLVDNIKAVVREYNGFVNLTCENNLFIIEIGLMFKEENSYDKAVQIFE